MGPKAGQATLWACVLAWKKTIAGEIASDQAEPIVRCIALPSFISAFVESSRLRSRALALALQCGRPVNECFYAACAEAASAPLVCCDETFLAALRGEGIAIRGVPLSRIHELEHFTSPTRVGEVSASYADGGVETHES